MSGLLNAAVMRRYRGGLAILMGLLLCSQLPASNATTEQSAKPDTDMNYRLDTIVEQPTQRFDSNSTADHSKFDELKGPFNNGPEVTRACLKCHTE
ncbi:MAG: hypothetical protein PVG66_15365, partial [Chromatiales bacterium]